VRSFKRLIVLTRRPLSAVGLLLVLVATTNAYSIVMKGGKRVEIPAQFTVTSTTLTYERAPGFLITLQMAAIDISATELANNEAPGSLMRRAVEQIQAAPESNVSYVSKAARSITNRDLESFQRVRLDSEQAYEQRLRAQGLPPLAVIRAEAAAKSDRFWEEMVQKRAEAEEAEEANQKAFELQAQISALTAQLNALQSRGNEIPYTESPFPVYDENPLFGSYGSYDPYNPYGSYNRFGYHRSLGRSRVNPNIWAVPPGVPIGGAFGTSTVPAWPSTQFRRLRPNAVFGRGTQVNRRGGWGGRSNGGRRHR